MENSNFVTQFYNLEGDTLSERKKNFSKLLKSQTSPLTEDDLKNLQPRTYLEELFQVDTYIHFKIITKLVDIVKDGNEVHISKILKHSLLIKEIIGNISAESFVNEFLPSTSYALRMKILKRITFYLDESEMDEIVFWVHKRYGLNIAIKLLHTCTSQKIREELSKHEVIFNPRQIKIIFDRDPELFTIYLKHYKTSTGKALKHKNLCRYIAREDAEMWFRLREEDLLGFARLGRKTSKNLIRVGHTDFFNNIQEHSYFLKLDIIVRELHGFFKEVYFQFFPKDVNNLDTSNFSHTLLKFYPKNKQWDLFAETFLRRFESDIRDKLLHLDSNFLKLFPDKSIMNAWGQAHYDKTKTNNFLKFCDTQKAIPLIKDKINVTSDIRNRSELIILLLENCAKNEDLTSLEDVLKYISVRHRNEDTVLSIIEHIMSLFKLESFKESHWNYINDLIAFLKVKNKHTYRLYKFPIKYMEYLCVQGKSFKKEMGTFLTDLHAEDTWHNVFLENPAAEKQLWIELIKTYPEVIKMDLKQFYKKRDDFICIVIHFNERHPGHSIDLEQFPNLFAHVKKIFDGKLLIMEKEKYIKQKIVAFNLKHPDKPIVTLTEAQILQTFLENKSNAYDFFFITEVIKLVKKSNRSDFENDVLEFFWEHLINNGTLVNRIVPWFFTHEPKTIIPHLEKLLQSMNVRWGVKMNHIKSMSHLGFDKKVIDHCFKKLESVDDFLKEIQEGRVPADVSPGKKLDFQGEILNILSRLLPTKEYIDVVEKRFLPTKKRIDTTDEVINEIYPFQCQAATYLQHVQHPSRVLPTLLKFCLGDYLKSAIPSLYSICYRSPEKLLYSYIDTLSKRAVSVRKHALFLTCELLTFDCALNKIQNANEMNVSSQKHVFSATLKYFRKNPSDELFKLVEINIKKIDENDEETLKNLSRLRMPKKYRELYIQKCWYFFEDLKKKDVFVETYLQLFLDSLRKSPDSLVSLPVDFCRHIITNYFKDIIGYDYNLHGIREFICMFLKYRKSEQDDNFKFVFDIIAAFKSSGRSKAIEEFFDDLYDIFVEDLNRNNKIDADNNYHIELFKEYWFKTFTLTEAFEQYVLLNLLYFKSRTSENWVEGYARGVVTYLEELIEEYGPHIYNKVKNLLLSKQSLSKKEKFLLFYHILKFKDSTLNCILVLELIKGDSPDDELKGIFDEIKDILNKSSAPVVSLYYKDCFGHNT